MWEFFKNHWRDGIEILILAVCIYQIHRTFRATRGAQILVGLVVILVFLTLLAIVADFQVISWIIKGAATALAFALIVIFQPELRDALARLGSKRLFSFSNRRRLDFMEKFADSVVILSKKRIGALFAIQRDISLNDYLDSGVILDARFSPELAYAVFHPKAPLHDGGMIIADDRVAGAACVFPVTEREMKDRSTGLRHRAAIGLTERSDALCIIVSEETGAISMSENGQLRRGLSEAEFRDELAKIFTSSKSTNENEPTEEPDRQDRIPSARDRSVVSD